MNCGQETGSDAILAHKYWQIGMVSCRYDGWISSSDSALALPLVCELGSPSNDFVAVNWACHSDYSEVLALGFSRV